MPRRWIGPAVIVALAAAFASCGRHQEEPVASVFPSQLHWPARPGATSYRVQAWSGLRLLFEESTSDTLLPLTESLLHAMAPFDSCRVEVRLADSGQESHEEVPFLEMFWVKRQPVPASDGAGGGARTHTN
jgi:hypothetical protein